MAGEALLVGLLLWHAAAAAPRPNHVHNGVQKQPVSDFQLLIPIKQDNYPKYEDSQETTPLTHKVFNDGPFSHIPADDFILDDFHFDDLKKKTVKKDLALEVSKYDDLLNHQIATGHKFYPSFMNTLDKALESENLRARCLQYIQKVGLWSDRQYIYSFCKRLLDRDTYGNDFVSAEYLDGPGYNHRNVYANEKEELDEHDDVKYDIHDYTKMGMHNAFLIKLLDALKKVRNDRDVKYYIIKNIEDDDSLNNYNDASSNQDDMNNLILPGHISRQVLGNDTIYKAAVSRDANSYAISKGNYLHENLTKKIESNKEFGSDSSKIDSIEDIVYTVGSLSNNRDNLDGTPKCVHVSLYIQNKDTHRHDESKGANIVKTRIAHLATTTVPMSLKPAGGRRGWVTFRGQHDKRRPLVVV